MMKYKEKMKEPYVIDDVIDTGTTLIGTLKNPENNRLPNGVVHTCRLEIREYELWRQGDFDRVAEIYSEYKQQLPKLAPLFILQIPAWYNYEGIKNKENELDEKILNSNLDYGKYKIRNDKVFSPSLIPGFAHKYDGFLDCALELLAIEKPEFKQALEKHYSGHFEFLRTQIPLEKLPCFLDIMEDYGRVYEELKLKERINDHARSNDYDDQTSVLNDIKIMKNAALGVINRTLQAVYGGKLVECNYFDEVSLNESKQTVEINFEFNECTFTEHLYSIVEMIKEIKPLLIKT